MKFYISTCDIYTAPTKTTAAVQNYKWLTKIKLQKTLFINTRQINATKDQLLVSQSGSGLPGSAAGVWSTRPSSAEFEVVIRSKLLSCRNTNLFTLLGFSELRLLFSSSPVMENNDSTGTDDALVPRYTAASRLRIGRRSAQSCQNSSAFSL